MGDRSVTSDLTLVPVVLSLPGEATGHNLALLSERADLQALMELHPLRCNGQNTVQVTDIKLKLDVSDDELISLSLQL